MCLFPPSRADPQPHCRRRAPRYLGELGSQLLLLSQSQPFGHTCPGRSRVIHGNICHGIGQQTFVGRVKVDICHRQGAEGTQDKQPASKARYANPRGKVKKGASPKRGRETPSGVSSVSIYQK